MEGMIERITRFSRNALQTVASGAIVQREALITKKRDETEEKRSELIMLIRETGKAIDAARSRFDLETDFDLIDSYIMEMDSLEKRYNFLIKEAKRERIAAF